MYFAFGFILGTIFRNNFVQSFPFPPFFWDFLANKPITKSDVYSIDHVLKDKINAIRTSDEHQQDQNWVYLDWNSEEKPIEGMPSKEFVTKATVDVYETIIVEQRISSLTSIFSIIKEGFDKSVGFSEVPEEFHFNGGLISYLCQGKESIDVEMLISVIEFEKETPELKKFTINMLRNFSPDQLRQFLFFATNTYNLPILEIYPDFKIHILFDDKPEDHLPFCHTCLKTIECPKYQTQEIFTNRFKKAIENQDMNEV